MEYKQITQQVLMMMFSVVFVLTIINLWKPPTKQQIIQKTEKNIVYLTGKSTSGTGFSFRYHQHDYILTNAHVVTGNQQVEVQYPNSTIGYAKIIERNNSEDVAILKPLAPESPPASFSLNDFSTKAQPIGTQVITEGYPMKMGFTATQGMITGENKHIASEGRQYPHLYQTDAPLNLGDSGGPLLNSWGKIIGVDTLIMNNGNGMGYAIPAQTIIKNIKKIS